MNLKIIFFVLILSCFVAKIIAFIHTTPRPNLFGKSLKRSSILSMSSKSIDDSYDVVIIGAGIGGLCAAAVLSSVYKLRVALFEHHYHPGGCAHSFSITSKPVNGRKTRYKFDAGPTIILGCSQKPFNPLRQVMNYIGAGNAIDWISWKKWGMVTEQGNWNFELGQNQFEAGPLLKFGGIDAVKEFSALRKACIPLTTGAAGIPSKALRGDQAKILPLLPYFSSLQKVVPYADILDGSFEPFMRDYVKNPWLRSWLDALAFSLSGLPAASTGAAAMAYTIYDLHRDGATLDYPRGGIGVISDVLVDIIRSAGSEVFLSTGVKGISVSQSRSNSAQVDGVYLHNNKFVKASRGVICNANIWSLPNLLEEQRDKLSADQHEFFFLNASRKSYTKSFMHLHLGLDATGLNKRSMEAHYTVMDMGLASADPCEDRNMVAVSNPSTLDDSLADQPNRLVIHAYGAGNEDYDLWEKYKNSRSSNEYKEFKSQQSKFLYRSVSRAIGISEDEIRARAEVALEGSPLTHEHFLNRYRGTYGASWGDMLGKMNLLSR
jgi:phytoene dehydrogenase-like protein